MEIQSKKRETSPIGLYLSFFPPRHQNKECLWFINHWPSTVTRIHNSKPLHYQIEGQVFSFCPYFYIITTSSVHGNNQQSNLEGLEHLPFRKGQPLNVSTLCLCWKAPLLFLFIKWQHKHTYTLSSQHALIMNSGSILCHSLDWGLLCTRLAWNNVLMASIRGKNINPKSPALEPLPSRVIHISLKFVTGCSVFMATSLPSLRCILSA